jgi:hypothetical protein
VGVRYFVKKFFLDGLCADLATCECVTLDREGAHEKIVDNH